MNQTGLVEQSQAVEQLLGEYANKSSTETTELVLLNQLVQIDAEQLEYQTKMLSMNECIFKPQQVVIVVLIKLGVQLFHVRTLH